MAAPVEQVHVDQRRIGQLHDEDLVARNGADRIGVDLARQRVETVENDPDIGVIGTAHHLPGIAVIADMAAPGQCLVTDAHAMFCGQFTELMEIGRSAVDAAERDLRDIRADQHQIGAEFAHDIEFPLSPLEGAGAVRFRHALEIAERLEEGDIKPVIGGKRLHLARGGVIGQEIILENLHAGKAGLGDGRQLFGELAADRHGCDGCAHWHAVSSCVIARHIAFLFSLMY